MNFLTTNDPNYSARKSRYTKRFFEALQRHPNFYWMIEFVDDPDKPGFKILHFFAMLGGNVNEKKVDIFNMALLIFLMNLQKLKTGEQEQEESEDIPFVSEYLDPTIDPKIQDPKNVNSLYKPKSLDTIMDKNVLAVLRANNINFYGQHLKTCACSVFGYCKKLQSAAAEIRPDFLETKKAHVEHDDLYYMYKCFNKGSVAVFLKETTGDKAYEHVWITFFGLIGMLNYVHWRYV